MEIDNDLLSKVGQMKKTMSQMKNELTHLRLHKDIITTSKETMLVPTTTILAKIITGTSMRTIKTIM